MNFVEIELERKKYNAETREEEVVGKDVYKFRLTSANAVKLEREVGKNVVDFLKDFSIGNVVKLLMYMLRWNMPNITVDKTYEIYDQFMDNGYDLAKIQNDVIAETMIVSGFFPREALEEAMEETALNQETE